MEELPKGTPKKAEPNAIDSVVDLEMERAREEKERQEERATMHKLTKIHARLAPFLSNPFSGPNAFDRFMSSRSELIEVIKAFLPLSQFDKISKGSPNSQDNLQHRCEAAIILLSEVSAETRLKRKTILSINGLIKALNKFCLRKGLRSQNLDDNTDEPTGFFTADGTTESQP